MLARYAPQCVLMTSRIAGGVSVSVREAQKAARESHELAFNSVYSTPHALSAISMAAEPERFVP
ncbi:hypothetical protein BN133_4107 [Cronobacter dublinensis 582]|nr:hypothetical protein BN133_4107 [Cronobacter dublinensis 582]